MKLLIMHGLALLLVFCASSIGAAEEPGGGDQIERADDRQHHRGITSDGSISFDQTGHSAIRLDRVSIAKNRRMLVVSINHVRGIGQAVLSLEKGDWPNETRIEFKHFGGLEGLTVRNGTRVASLFAPDGEPAGTVISVKRSNKKVTASLPWGFLKNEDRQCSLNWVDFYR